MTVFGFNTDIKYADTVYHVQSEERTNDLVLQTQVFVRGRCIGKRATPYKNLAGSHEFSESAAHDMLKAQHRAMVEAIRSGRVAEALAAPAPMAMISEPRSGGPAAGSKVPEQVAEMPTGPEPVLDSTPQLSLELINSESIFLEDAVTLCLLVTDAEIPIAGARLVCRFSLTTPGGEEAPIYSQGVTGIDGIAEVRLFLDEAALHDATVLVQATHAGQTATRKFRVRGK
ncbi:MAG TPA: hypothetical protein VN622_10695 [Clostridia bacterium]|nr:hypothetical protein [Clostridia bacterium]